MNKPWCVNLTLDASRDGEIEVRDGKIHVTQRGAAITIKPEALQAFMECLLNASRALPAPVESSRLLPASTKSH